MFHCGMVPAVPAKVNVDATCAGDEVERRWKHQNSDTFRNVISVIHP